MEAKEWGYVLLAIVINAPWIYAFIHFVFITPSKINRPRKKRWKNCTNSKFNGIKTTLIDTAYAVWTVNIVKPVTEKKDQSRLKINVLI